MASGERSDHFPAIERRHGQPIQFWLDRLAELGDAKYDAQIAYLRAEHGFSRTHANAVVMTARGSTTSRRFATPEDWFAAAEPQAAATARAIFATITSEVGDLELVTAWNQPTLRTPEGYVFGLGAAATHLLLNPFSEAALEAAGTLLDGYTVNTHTIRVPLDWTPDADLLGALVRGRLAELR